jgi:anti-sigma-K factor RskA
MTPPDDIEALAGEYVLGTLDVAERATVAARRQREPVLDIAISAWEARLASLNDLATPVAPPPDLFHRITQSLDRSLEAARAKSPSALVELADLQRRVARWKRVAVAASAMAATLALVIGLRETVYRPQQPAYVAVFAKDDVLPSFYLTMDLEKRELTIRPIDARRQAGKTYQLWIASDQLGPAPQSLGLMDDDLAPTRKQLSFDPALLRRATFGVSLEPEGGSPTGRPTSPALHAKLLPVTH